MTSIEIEDLYDRQICALAPRDRLLLAQRIMRDTVREAEQVTKEQRSHSLLELEGLGAELWQETEAQEYVDKLRGEWEEGR